MRTPSRASGIVRMFLTLRRLARAPRRWLVGEPQRPRASRSGYQIRRPRHRPRGAGRAPAVRARDWRGSPGCPGSRSRDPGSVRPIRVREALGTIPFNSRFRPIGISASGGRCHSCPTRLFHLGLHIHREQRSELLQQIKAGAVDEVVVLSGEGTGRRGAVDAHLPFPPAAAAATCITRPVTNRQLSS